MAKNILVVDDEELVIESLKRLLKKDGYNPVVVQSGKAALEKIKEMDFDLVVSDVRMPEMDGVEIVRNIRDYLKQAKKKPIPEILITGYSDENVLKDIRELKVADFMYKPFDIVEFLEIVKKNLKPE